MAIVPCSMIVTCNFDIRISIVRDTRNNSRRNEMSRWNCEQGRSEKLVRVSMKHVHVHHAGVTRRPKHLGISCEFSRNRWQQRAGPTHTHAHTRRETGTRNEEKRMSARVRSASQYDRKRYKCIEKEQRHVSVRKYESKRDADRADVREKTKRNVP